MAETNEAHNFKETVFDIHVFEHPNKAWGGNVFVELFVLQRSFIRETAKRVIKMSTPKNRRISIIVVPFSLLREAFTSSDTVSCEDDSLET